MNSDKAIKSSRFHIDKLEERIAPGTLAVRPPAMVTDGTSNTLTDAAKPGLQTAEAHTNGVITWPPGT